MSSILKANEYTCEGCGVVFLNPTKPESCTLCKQVNTLRGNAENGDYGLTDKNDNDNNVNALFNEDNEDSGILFYADMALLSAQSTIQQGTAVLITWLKSKDNSMKDKQLDHFNHYINAVRKYVNTSENQDTFLLNTILEKVNGYKKYGNNPQINDIGSALENHKTMRTTIALVILRNLNVEIIRRLQSHMIPSILDAAVFEAIATTLNIIDNDGPHPAKVTALEACTAVYAHKRHEELTDDSGSVEPSDDDDDDNDDDDDDDDPYSDARDTVDEVANYLANLPLPQATDLQPLDKDSLIASVPDGKSLEQLNLGLYMIDGVESDDPKVNRLGLLYDITVEGKKTLIKYVVNDTFTTSSKEYENGDLYLSDAELETEGVLDTYNAKIGSGGPSASEEPDAEGGSPDTPAATPVPVQLEKLNKDVLKLLCGKKNGKYLVKSNMKINVYDITENQSIGHLTRIGTNMANSFFVKPTPYLVAKYPNQKDKTEINIQQPTGNSPKYRYDFNNVTDTVVKQALDSLKAANAASKATKKVLFM